MGQELSQLPPEFLQRQLLVKKLRRLRGGKDTGYARVGRQRPVRKLQLNQQRTRPA